MAQGRPTKLNHEIQEKIVMVIRAGNYIEAAAAYAGITKHAIYDWMKRGEREKQRLAKPGARPRKEEAPFVAFSDAIQKAQAEAEIREVNTIVRASAESWQAAAWRLERKHPDRWGRKRLDVDVNANVKGQVEVRDEVARQIIEDPEASALAHRLLERIAEGEPSGICLPCEPEEVDSR